MMGGFVLFLSVVLLAPTVASQANDGGAGGGDGNTGGGSLYGGLADWCYGSTFSPSADVMVARFHDARLGVCGGADELKRSAVPCHKFSVFSPEGLLCRMMDHPITMRDWEIDTRRREIVCNLDVATFPIKCEYCCSGHDSVRCETKAPVLIRYVYEFLYKLIHKVSVVDRARIQMENEVFVSALVGALKRNLLNILAQLLSAAVFVKPLPGFVRVISVVVASVLYLWTGGVVQMLGTLAVAFTYTAGGTVNNNNVYLAFGSLMLSIVVVAVDAANNVFFSFGVTFLLVLMQVALVVAVVTKKLTFDVGTLIHFITGMINIVSNYRLIILAKRTDPAIAFIVYTLDAAIPWGSLFVPFSTTRTEEARILADVVIKALRLDADLLLPIWCGSFLYAYIVFIGMRAILGFQITKRVRGINTVQALWDGFLLVWTDVLSPFEVVGHIMAGRGPKHFAFDFCAALLKIFEFCYAPELAIFSVIAALGMLMFDYKVIRIAKTLADHSFGGGFMCDLASFPVIGSIPHVDVNTLCALRRAVVRIGVTTDNMSRAGVGFMVRRAGELYVYSVDHVLEGGRRLRFGATGVEASFSGAQRETYGTNPDPVVAARLKASDIDTGKLSAHGNVPVDDMAVLSMSELSLTKALLYLSPDGFVNYIGSNMFRATSDSFEVSVDLKHGDSGSPLFAVLYDGKVRYAGAVSRAKGGGEANIVASVVERPKSYSPGTPVDNSTVTVNAVYADPRSFVIKLANAIQESTLALATDKDMPANAKKKRRSAARKALETLQELGVMKDDFAAVVAASINDDAAVRFNWERGAPHFVGGLAELGGAGGMPAGDASV